MTGEEPPRLPRPPPPPSFPTAAPFRRERSTTGHTHTASNSAHFQAPPLPVPGNNYPSPIPDPQAYRSYIPPRPDRPPPIRSSTRPHNETTHAPSPAYATHPAPPYEYAPPPPSRQMSDSASLHSAFTDPGPSIPARHPFTAIGTNTSTSRPPQHLVTMPVPVLPNTAASGSYSYDSYSSDSSPPNIARPLPQAPILGGPLLPEPEELDWSYLDLHDRDNNSSGSEDESFVQSPGSMSNSSEYTGHKGRPNHPYAGRRRQPSRQLSQATASSSSSHAYRDPDLDECKQCWQKGSRRQWANLEHPGFCSEEHKWAYDSRPHRPPQ